VVDVEVDGDIWWIVSDGESSCYPAGSMMDERAVEGVAGEYVVGRGLGKGAQGSVKLGTVRSTGEVSHAVLCQSRHGGGGRLRGSVLQPCCRVHVHSVLALSRMPRSVNSCKPYGQCPCVWLSPLIAASRPEVHFQGQAWIT
jgi:hypothetical protein